MAGQHLSEPDQTERTPRVRGQQAVRILRKVGVEFPNRARPVGSSFRLQAVDRIGRDRRDIGQYPVAQPLKCCGHLMLRRCRHEVGWGRRTVVR